MTRYYDTAGAQFVNCLDSVYTTKEKAEEALTNKPISISIWDDDNWVDVSYDIIEKELI